MKNNPVGVAEGGRRSVPIVVKNNHPFTGQNVVIFTTTIWEGASLDPRPIRLQLNARSPPRPGIDCIWACIWACAVVAVVAQVFAQKRANT